MPLNDRVGKAAGAISPSTQAPRYADHVEESLLGLPRDHYRVVPQ
ncbi:hypothetical protein QF031_002219 [Pseudarthrobacter defluvii]|nr:hypothetical protein [Pseudarthrobacter defluvii]MDQ0769470.1 hypothetical protein [Pseudarthrobacter defluvii]